MSRIINLKGRKFGKLTIIEKAESIKRKNGGTRARWLCKCECGTTKIIRASDLLSNKVFSCGCYHKEIISFKNNINYKHGKSKTRLYYIYNNMKSRCYNPKNKRYKNYGGRNIKICKEWLNKENGFINFYNWAIKNGYKETLSIDRIDNDGNYEPNNCRWTTMKVQANNTTRNHYLMYKNKKYTLTQLSELLNVEHKKLIKLIKKGEFRGKCQDLQEKLEEIN